MRLPYTLALMMGLAMPAAADNTGFRQFEIPSPDRPLAATVWYPSAEGGKPETVGENAAFFGVEVRRDGEPSTGKRPLVLLSHGYGGSWRNLNWLAERLVRQGYTVAAVDHPGTTTFDRSSGEAARLWKRPQDMSKLLDSVLADAKIAGEVDADKVAAVGHSLGGWTVMSLIGARFNTTQFLDDCKTPVSTRACSLATELGIGAGRSGALDAYKGDPRIKAAVSLDLGLARGFTAESLEALAKPVLVIGAGVDIGDLPAQFESGWLAEHLPPSSSTSLTIPDALHFTFMMLCKPGAVEKIEAEVPGDGVVCKDPGPRDRRAIHDEVADRVMTLLDGALK